MAKKDKNILLTVFVAIIIVLAIFFVLLSTDYIDVLDSENELSLTGFPISVSKPSSGSTLDATTSMLVRIETTLSNTNVEIYLRWGSGSQLKLGDMPLGSGSYIEAGKYFQIPSSIETRTDYRVRATALYNGVNYATFSGYFTINADTRKVTVLSPNGGEELYPGSTYRISVSAKIDGSRNILLHLAKGDTYNYYHIINILDAHTGTHSYQWTVPLSIPGGSQYRIRAALRGTSISDYSVS